jgi:hypothetical protein
MDLEYSPSAATALLLANLTTLASRGVVNSTSTPTTEHLRHLEVFRSVPSANYSVGQPASTSSSSSSSSASPTSTIPAGADYSNILKGVLNDLARHATPTSPTVVTPASPPPTVVIINQQPPPQPSSWSTETDLAVGVSSFLLLLLMTGACCWLLRRFRPEAWRTVKVVILRVLRSVALPLSWLCGQVSLLLERLHRTGQPTSQVFYFISFLANWYTLSYVIGP